MLKSVIVAMVLMMASQASAQWTAASYFGYDSLCEADELVVRADVEAAAYKALWQGFQGEITAKRAYALIKAAAQQGDLSCMSADHRRKAIASMIYAKIPSAPCPPGNDFSCNQFMMDQLQAYARRDYLRAGWVDSED